MSDNLQKLLDAKDWVFDLDNTLYPQESALFPQIHAKMTDYIVKLLDLSPAEASKLQKKYYVENGTTLNGLMLNHKIDPYDYLNKVHDIDYSDIKPNPALREAILSLPSRKTVFTNGSRGHAERTLKALGLEDVFNDLIDIAATNFVPKPEPKAFQTVIDSHNMNPNSSVMVEDLSKNLVTAHKMGFMTVLVWSNHIDENEPEGLRPASFDDTKNEFINYNTDNLSRFINNVLNTGKQ